MKRGKKKRKLTGDEKSEKGLVKLIKKGLFR